LIPNSNLGDGKVEGDRGIGENKADQDRLVECCQRLIFLEEFKKKERNTERIR